MHERVKSEVFADMGDSTSNASTSNDNSFGNISNIGKEMGDWFVRDLLPISYRHGVQSDSEQTHEELVHYEPIRLPSMIDSIVSSIVAACNSGNRGAQESSLDAMNLLTICHAYNLGVVNHVCGIQFLHSSEREAVARASRSTTTDFVTVSSAKAKARIYLDLAARMYEITLLTERAARSRAKRDQRHNENGSYRKIETNVPRLIIVLASLNNLADLSYKKNQDVRCMYFYIKLKSTTERLADILHPRQHHRDGRLLRSSLSTFWTMWQKGFSRLRRTRTNRSDRNSETMNDHEDPGEENPSTSAQTTSRSPSSVQSYYAFNNSAAAAA
jgi:hypothetical protein